MLVICSLDDRTCLAVVVLFHTETSFKTVFTEYNQQDVTFHSLSIPVRCSTCFRRFIRPSSGAQNCIYNVRYLSDQYCYLLLAWLAAGSSIGLTNT